LKYSADLDKFKLVSSGLEKERKCEKKMVKDKLATQSIGKFFIPNKKEDGDKEETKEEKMEF
jgi:hypothetical protein